MHSSLYQSACNSVVSDFSYTMTSNADKCRSIVCRHLRRTSAMMRRSSYASLAHMASKCASRGESLC